MEDKAKESRKSPERKRAWKMKITNSAKCQREQGRGREASERTLDLIIYLFIFRTLDLIAGEYLCFQGTFIKEGEKKLDFSWQE